ncbi:hypothetical protein M8C21_004340 [Ambrosia artemisiifolia]|uniref:non-specific serine/threonine protein kinase n=1 Tax=Ambrosia artemisiifolia TaxID=4212 RepID=A0AAD5BZ05_AMBAR|nr:hypothetical protein M8C21_004340 [Ambrosia artemisiifolia]
MCETGEALTALKNKLTDPNNIMQSWDSTLPSPCTWFHVTCNVDNSVTRIDLGSANLSGQLVPELGQLPNLQYLELYSNNITGTIPTELGKLKSLMSLDLYSNRLTGGIPDTLGQLKSLRFLRLNNNTLTGIIPMSLTNISSLQVLDLSNNALIGPVPINGSFSSFTNLSFLNNPNLTFPTIVQQAPPPPPSVGSSATGPIAIGLATGAAVLFLAPFIAIAWWRYTKSQDQFFDIPAEEDPRVHVGQLKRFSLRELQVATDSFSSKNVLGSELVTGQRAYDLARLEKDNEVMLLDWRSWRRRFVWSTGPELGQLTNLQYLELLGNNIAGKIPSEQGELKNLVSLDLYSNRLEGNIPDTLGDLKKLRFLFRNNSNLTFLWAPPANLQPPKVGSSATRPIAIGLATGAALLFLAPFIAIAWWWCTKSHDHFFDIPAEEDPKVHVGQLKRFSLRELQVATDSFSSKKVLGSGGFGKVYKGRLADGGLVVVKRLKEERINGGELQFQTEVEMISMAVHRNLLRLKGFCMTPTERLLVYPYMVNGSVASCLRERRATQPVLDWPTRERIALGAAKGLAYLHEQSNPKIIHSDVKAANILLDGEFEVVVGDFGLAKPMEYKDTHVTTAVCGTIGHISPEYLSTGRSSEKTDVFGYGVMLLELVTGQRAYDLARLEKDNEVMLLDWVSILLHHHLFLDCL